MNKQYREFITDLAALEVLDDQKVSIPKVVDAFFAELQKGCGSYDAYDQFLQDLQGEFRDRETLEYRSRSVVDKLAVALQASVLIQKGDELIADAFVRSRIVRNGAFNYGTLEAGIDCEAIMKRAQPAVV